MRIIFIDLLSETQRSTSLKYLLASVAGLSFYPQWITHLLMTAGIDSNYKIPIQHFIKVPFCWLKLSTKFPTCYLSAVCFFFRELVRELNGKSDEVLTRQPDQHHRVVFQPPPSLDGGLDGQSMLLFLNSFYCLSKAMARLLPIGETFQRIVQSCKPEGLFLSNQTLFSSKPELHHRMFLCINNCPCSYTLSGYKSFLSAISLEKLQFEFRNGCSKPYSSEYYCKSEFLNFPSTLLISSPTSFWNVVDWLVAQNLSKFSSYSKLALSKLSVSK